jgi:uncharacterized DUF497 family protein
MSPFGCANFDWDEGNLKHIARHDVSQMEVEQVVRDDRCLLESSEVRRGELGYNVTGAAADGQVLTVIFEIRRYAIRTVTAYTATKPKQAAYWKRRNHGNEAPVS